MPGHDKDDTSARISGVTPDGSAATTREGLDGLTKKPCATQKSVTVLFVEYREAAWNRMALMDGELGPRVVQASIHSTRSPATRA